MQVRENRNMQNRLMTTIIGFLFCNPLFAQNSKNVSSFDLNLINKYNNTEFQVPDSLSRLPQLTKAPNYLGIYHKELGVFCKLENKALKQNNVPIKMRIGDVQYVDKLESKVPAFRSPEQP